MKRFEDLDVWRKFYKLSVNIYKTFRGCKDYSFKDQITRSSYVRKACAKGRTPFQVVFDAGYR